ncbi:hypothetical protein D3C78_1551560 [compost metagenome]
MLRRVGLQPLGQFQHGRHARGVVVGAVIDLAVVDPHVVIVGCDHDILVRDARAGNDADDVGPVKGLHALARAPLHLPGLQPPHRRGLNAQGLQPPDNVFARLGAAL